MLESFDIEDNLNLTEAEWQEEICGTWRVIGANLETSTPVLDKKEYHIPHTYSTKLSHIVVTADSMKFVYNSPITLIIQVPSSLQEGLILNWQDGPAFSVTECSFAYKTSGDKCIRGAGIGPLTESWRKYTEDWMTYLHGTELGEMKEITEATMLYEPFMNFHSEFFSKDDEHACRLFITFGNVTYEMVR